MLKGAKPSEVRRPVGHTRRLQCASVCETGAQASKQAGSGHVRAQSFVCVSEHGQGCGHVTLTEQKMCGRGNGATGGLVRTRQRPMTRLYAANGGLSLSRRVTRESRGPLVLPEDTANHSIYEGSMRRLWQCNADA